MIPEINSLAIIPYNYSSYEDHLEFNDKLLELKYKLSDVSESISFARLGRLEKLEARASLDDIQSQAMELKKSIEANNYSIQSGSLEDINQLIIKIEETICIFNKRHFNLFSKLTEKKASTISQQFRYDQYSLKDYKTWTLRCDKLSRVTRQQQERRDLIFSRLSAVILLQAKLIEIMFKSTTI